MGGDEELGRNLEPPILPPRLWPGTPASACETPFQFIQQRPGSTWWHRQDASACRPEEHPGWHGERTPKGTDLPPRLGPGEKRRHPCTSLFFFRGVRATSRCADESGRECGERASPGMRAGGVGVGASRTLDPDRGCDQGHQHRRSRQPVGLCHVNTRRDSMPSSSVRHAARTHADFSQAAAAPKTLDFTRCLPEHDKDADKRDDPEGLQRQSIVQSSNTPSWHA